MTHLTSTRNLKIARIFCEDPSQPKKIRIEGIQTQNPNSCTIHYDFYGKNMVDVVDVIAVFIETCRCDIRECQPAFIFFFSHLFLHTRDICSSSYLRFAASGVGWETKSLPTARHCASCFWFRCEDGSTS